MGFYSRNVFPPLCDLLLDRPEVAQHRRELLAAARGDILEIGFGTGLNLACYPESVRKLITVDPNPGMNARAQRRVRQSQIEIEQHLLSGERLPFENETFDCVVSTFTLCSIPHVAQALAEAHRVLCPGGKFLFLEHGLSPEPRVQRWQRRMNWLERLLADGCHLDRPIGELVSAQPFSKVELREQYLEKTPQTHGYVYIGAATK